jgi:anti-anti-sigma factor
MRLAFWLRAPFLGLAWVARRAGQHLRARGDAGKPAAEAAHLEIEVLEREKGPVVRLRGEAGVAEANTLDAFALRLLARRPACVTFDLSELDFISSLGMGVLAAYRHAAVRAGTRVCLVAELRPAVHEALHKTELLGLFETVGSVRASVKAPPGAQDSRARDPNVVDVQRSYGVTWGQLVELERHLETLLEGAQQAGARCRCFTDVDRVFGPLRNELAGLVGFAGKYHRHPILGTAGAYEVAYWTLYDAVAGSVAGRAGSANEAPVKQ